MPASTEIHAFLDIKSEEEASTQGVSLTDKFAHHVYRSVRARSTAGAISRDEFFTLDTVVRELPGLPRRDLITILERLIQDRLVCQLFVLENAPGDRSLRVRPIFVARSERGGPVFPLFLQSLHVCEEALRRRLDALEVIGAEELHSDLELDLAATAMPRPGELLGFGGGLLSQVAASGFEIQPPPELIAAVQGHLRRRLLEMGAVLFVRGFGPAPLRAAPARLRFLVAEQFLEERVLPLHRRDPDLSRELESIALEEASLVAQAAHEARQRQTGTVPGAISVESVHLAARRAGAILRTFLRKAGTRRWFPGALCVETVLATAETVSTELKAEARHAEENRLVELRDRVLPVADPLRAEFLFLSQREWDCEGTEVQKKLIADSALLYLTFELPGTTMHVFAPAETAPFVQCVERLYGLPRAHGWKYWAVARLIELYASRLPGMNEDRKFQNELQRSLYQNARPYLRLPHSLFYLPGRFFPAPLLRKATEAMLTEQHTLRQSNKVGSRTRAMRREAGRVAAVRRAGAAALSGLIEERLDDFYFRERRVPCVADLVYSFRAVEARLVREALREGGFLLDGEAASEESLVLYAPDENWPARGDRLRAELPALLETARSGPPERGERWLGRVERLRQALAEPRPIYRFVGTKNAEGRTAGGKAVGSGGKTQPTGAPPATGAASVETSRGDAPSGPVLRPKFGRYEVLGTSDPEEERLPSPALFVRTG